MMHLRNAIENSALWAAYGDALGFITELTDRRGLARRAGSDRIEGTVPWTRLVGGKFGANADFPAGTYSDDTQLRLATSRAIDGRGHFDVEAFAKVELPVWQGYALGAGIGTKAAASNLSKQNVTWFSNFYSEGKAKYLNSGGNGAAMRIQPLIWAAVNEPVIGQWLLNVIRNSVCTHGHPTGIAGSVYHGLSLKFTFDREEAPPPSQWLDFVHIMRDIPQLMRQDDELSSFWLPAWRSNASRDFNDAWHECLDGFEKDLLSLQKLLTDRASRRVNFQDLVRSIGADRAETRGAGTKTAALASAAAWMHRSATSPQEALVDISNDLECDTDSIATMAGALMGAIMPIEARGSLQDREYIRSEASRIVGLVEGREGKSFSYPDLLRWQPPKLQQDVVTARSGKLLIEGFGEAVPISRTFIGRTPDVLWQWVRLNFGQTILVKRKAGLLREDSMPNEAIPAKEVSRNIQVDLFERPDRQQSIDLDHLTNAAIRSGFDPLLIGNHVIALSDQNAGIEQVIAYAAIISKARVSRRGR